MDMYSDRQYNTKHSRTIGIIHALRATNSFATNLDVSLLWDVRGVSRVVKRAERVFRGD